MAIELQSTSTGFLVSAPTTRRFIDFARHLGAVQQGDSWLFQPQQEKAVRDFLFRRPETAKPAPPPASLVPPAPMPAPIAPVAAPGRSVEESLAILFDPSRPMGDHVKSVSDLALALDPRSTADLLEEASAAFESFAARLRQWAARTVPG